MNCLQFRHRYSVDPYNLPEPMRAHRSHCSGCALFAAEQDAFNDSLERAMDIRTPPGLESRILARHARRESQRTRTRIAGLLALAATIVLGVAVGVWMAPWLGGQQLGEAVVEYLQEQSDHFPPRAPVHADEIDALFLSAGMRFQSDIVSVLQAKPCVIRGTAAIYLQVASDSGPVSVLIMPKQTVIERTAVVEAGYKGVIVPCPKGSMAVLGVPGQPIDDVEKRMRAATQWL